MNLDGDAPGGATGQGHGHGHGHGHGRAEGRPGLAAWLRSVFRPHSHDAADSVDHVLEASADGIRAVKLSLAGLSLTAAVQALVVAASGSVALLADTIHNLADALTALPLWVAFALSRRTPSRRYTYGYGRAEDIAGVVIVVTIAVSAAIAAYESIVRLRDPSPVSRPGWVLLAGLIGFAGNELVAMYRIRVGRRIGSAALVADGLHARTDGFTSLAVVVGAIGVMAGVPRADPIVGLLITVAILAVLRGAARDIYRRLMDAVDPELVDVAERALRDVPGVADVDELRLRWIGHRIRAETGLVVDGALSLSAAHAIAEEARHRLLHEVPRLDDATIHVSPVSADGEDHHALTAHHRR